jgi:ankyrin repeat protein
MRKWIVMVILLYCPLLWAGSYDEFFDAIDRDNGEAVQLLMQRGLDPETADHHGNPAPLIAARDGREYALKVLLQAGADINAENPYRETALMLASYNGHLEIVR